MKQTTNAIRMVERLALPHRIHTYSPEQGISGVEVAAQLEEDPARVFKTLVTQGKRGGHFVFLVPVSTELNLKKAAAASGEKSIEMLKAAALLPTTGYVHGGCSPIGMKKQFPTFVDERAKALSTLYISGGKIGLQIELSPGDLQKVIAFQYAQLAD